MNFTCLKKRSQFEKRSLDAVDWRLLFSATESADESESQIKNYFQVHTLKLC